jgi:hypothetical protein
VIPSSTPLPLPSTHDPWPTRALRCLQRYQPCHQSYASPLSETICYFHAEPDVAHRAAPSPPCNCCAAVLVIPPKLTYGRLLAVGPIHRSPSSTTWIQVFVDKSLPLGSCGPSHHLVPSTPQDSSRRTYLSPGSITVNNATNESTSSTRGSTYASRTGRHRRIIAACATCNPHSVLIDYGRLLPSFDTPVSILDLDTGVCRQVYRLARVRLHFWYQRLLTKMDSRRRTSPPGSITCPICHEQSLPLPQSYSMSSMYFYIPLLLVVQPRSDNEVRRLRRFAWRSVTFSCVTFPQHALRAAFRSKFIPSCDRPNGLPPLPSLLSVAVNFRLVAFHLLLLLSSSGSCSSLYFRDSTSVSATVAAGERTLTPIYRLNKIKRYILHLHINFAVSALSSR